MKTIGLIGGMSWESSALYYAAINRGVRARLGGSHSAQILLDSCDFAVVQQLQHDGEWDRLGEMLADSARRLESGGADLLVLCTNTMHKLAGDIDAAVQIPLLHIADPLGEAIRAADISCVGLLGTAFTMEQPFLKDRLRDKHDLHCLVPGTDARAAVHRVIYEELIAGDIRPESRERYVKVIEQLADEGAQGIILGCTEIGMLVKQEHSPLPLFDTTELHAAAAVKAALA